MIEFDKKPPFQITESYIQPWVAGIKEGGSGNNLWFGLTYTGNSEVIFEKAYFRGQVKDVQQTGPNPESIMITFKNGERPDIVMNSDPDEEAQNLPSYRLRFDLKDNEAVLSYLADGRQQYYKLESIPEKDLLAYPGSRPNNEQ